MENIIISNIQKHRDDDDEEEETQRAIERRLSSIICITKN